MFLTATGTDPLTRGTNLLKFVPSWPLFHFVCVRSYKEGATSFFIHCGAEGGGRKTDGFPVGEQNSKEIRICPSSLFMLS